MTGINGSLGSCRAPLQTGAFRQTIKFRKQFHATASSPSICRALAHPLSHIRPPPPSLLAKHTLSVCPPIGRGELPRSEVARAQRQQGACGRGDSLTFHRPLSPDLFIALCLLLLLLLMKGGRGKNSTDRAREGKKRGVILSVCRPRGCVCEGL